MKSRIKLLCVALIVMFSISLCTLQVFATPEAEQPGNNTAETVATEEPPVYTEPPTEPDTNPPTEATVPPTEAPTVPPTEATSSSTAATTPPTVAPTSPVTTTPVYGSNDEEPETYAQEDDNTDITPQSSFYDTDGKRVDTDNLKKSDWNEIAEMLKNADGSGDAHDFGFIQNNNGGGDNGFWILFGGIALIVIGTAIIVFVIVFEIRKKKNLKNNKHNRNGKNPPAGKLNHSEPRKKPVTPAEKKQINRRSKFDTADVFIPRRTPASKKRTYGGTRYKPKH